LNHLNHLNHLKQKQMERQKGKRKKAKGCWLSAVGYQLSAVKRASVTKNQSVFWLFNDSYS